MHKNMTEDINYLVEYGRIIEEVWNGEHNSDDWCCTCKYNGEDGHYLRYCNFHEFSSFGMHITNCIRYKIRKD